VSDGLKLILEDSSGDETKIRDRSVDL